MTLHGLEKNSSDLNTKIIITYWKTSALFNAIILVFTSSNYVARQERIKIIDKLTKILELYHLIDHKSKN